MTSPPCDSGIVPLLSRPQGSFAARVRTFTRQDLTTTVDRIARAADQARPDDSGREKERRNMT